jgi:hypothetical protein
LREAQRVVFNGERGMDRADAILPPELGRKPHCRTLPTPQCLTDPRKQINQARGDGKWRGVGHGLAILGKEIVNDEELADSQSRLLSMV